MSRAGSPALTALAAGLLMILAAACSVVDQAATWKSTGPAAGPGASPARSAGPPPPAYDVAALRAPAKKYLGVEIPGAPDALAPAARFAAWTGRKPNLIGAYVGWNTGLDAQAVRNAQAYGALYFQVWEPFGISAAQIAAGAADDYITGFARSVRTLNLPMALSFGHEMNGDWYPWGTKQTTAADFVAAWRHIHDLFAAAGATNVIWVWNPNDEYPVPNVRLAPLYPGDAYVDWIGVTGYWTPTGPQTYARLFLPTLLDVRKFTAKPFLIAETSVLPGPGQVADVNELFHAVQTHPDIIGLVWYDYDRQGDWRVETRPAVLAAFRADAADPVFGFDAGAAR